MTRPTEQPVLALSEIDGGSPLRVAARAGGWTLLPAGTWRLHAKAVMRSRASLAVFEVDSFRDDTSRLCMAFRELGRRIHVIAVTPKHTLELERRARAAGVAAYLPAEDPDTICHAVAAVFEPVGSLRRSEKLAGIPPGSGLEWLARPGPEQHRGHDP